MTNSGFHGWLLDQPATPPHPHPPHLCLSPLPPPHTPFLQTCAIAARRRAAALLGATSAARCAPPLAVAAAPVAAAPALAPPRCSSAAAPLAGAAALSAVARRRVRGRLLSSAAADRRAPRLEGVAADWRLPARAPRQGRQLPCVLLVAGEREGAVDRLLDLHAIAGLARRAARRARRPGVRCRWGCCGLLYLSMLRRADLVSVWLGEPAV